MLFWYLYWFTVHIFYIYGALLCFHIFWKIDQNIKQTMYLNDVVRVQTKPFQQFSLFTQILFFLMPLAFLFFLEYTSSGTLIEIRRLWSFLGNPCPLWSSSIYVYY